MTDWMTSRSQLMVKTKLKQSGTGSVKKSGTPSCLIDSLEADQQHDRDDWVIVKKQRVTILIPPVPFSKRSIAANHEPSPKHLVPPKISSNRSQHQAVMSTVLPPFNEQNKTVSLPAQKEIRVDRKAPHPQLNSALAKAARVDQRMEFDIRQQVNNLNSHKLPGVSKTSKVIKQPRLLFAPSRPSNLGITLNQGLRASNLERKLERAGGLSRWLTSLGLDQFVRIFQGKRLSKYQLVNLTMKKLKDMGANAVGPRRKLIHAIDCVCQPYCFEAL